MSNLTEEIAVLDRIIAKTEHLIKIAGECGFDLQVCELWLELEDLRKYRAFLSSDGECQ